MSRYLGVAGGIPRANASHCLFLASLVRHYTAKKKNSPPAAQSEYIFELHFWLFSGGVNMCRILMLQMQTQTPPQKKSIILYRLM